jgi:hypothetical protein
MIRPGRGRCSLRRQVTAVPGAGIRRLRGQLGGVQGRMLRVRRVPAWRSAAIGVEGTDSYTAFGYANPAGRVLTSVLNTRAEVRQVASEDDRDDGDGAEARDQPHLEYTSDVIDAVETYLYRPGLWMFGAVVSVAKRLQSAAWTPIASTCSLLWSPSLRW